MINKPIIFSVIVPFLNEEEYIEDCIRALLNQDINPQAYELIFIDNGSHDRSSAIAQKYPRIRLLTEGKKDPYIARNRGLEVASGKYIAFTDADCVVPPNWLSTLYQDMDSKNSDIALGPIVYPNNASIFLKRYAEYYNTKTDLLIEIELKECYYGHAGNMAVRASIFEEIGLFASMPIVGDTAVIHDWLERHPDAPIHYIPEIPVVHLEVTRHGQCLRKLFECGRYSEVYQHYSSYRPLRFNEKLRVFFSSAERYNYSLWDKGILILMLVTGLISFKFGCLSIRKKS